MRENYREEMRKIIDSPVDYDVILLARDQKSNQMGCLRDVKDNDSLHILQNFLGYTYLTNRNDVIDGKVDNIVQFKRDQQ